MKKLIRSVLFVVMICALAAGLAACGKSVTAPIQLAVNDLNVLTWKEVADARGYTVRIKSVGTEEQNDYPTSRNRYSLSDLEEGDYELCVMAVSGNKDLNDSEWSKVLSFHKERETGCVYQLINANREYEIVKYGTASGDLVIEDMHHGKPVTSIAEKAFRGCAKITSVTIGANVTSIGDYAFMNCSNLRSVTIPDSVTYIGEGAFQQCKALESVKLPELLEEVKDYTFAYCRGLKDLQFNENLKLIDGYSFTACSALIEVKIPDSVESIGEYAFSACDNLETLSFGANVVSTGECAFSNNYNLTQINFAEQGKLEILGDSTFKSCSALASVALPDGLKTLDARVFNGCTLLDSVTIPESVTKVGSYCFSYTKLYNDQNTEENENGFIYADKWVINVLSSLATPDRDADGNITREGLMTIDENTFKEGTFGIADRACAQMYSLRTLSLNRSIKYIGLYSFASCSRLWRVQTSDNGLKEIGERAFYNCPLITQLRLSEGLETIETLAFYRCTNITTSVFNNTDIIPSTVTRIGENAFYQTGVIDETDTTPRAVYMGRWVVGFVAGNSSAVNISLNSGTVGIADYAFYRFTSLLNISGLSDVRYIGKGAFWGCTNLGSVSLGQNLREINDYTFSRCENLFRVSFPTNLRKISTGAFYGCSTLNDVDLSSTRIETIADRAFYGCANLKTLDLNASYRGEKTLTSIGERAFYGCISLGADPNRAVEEAEDITGEEPVEEEEESVNGNIVVIPYSVKTIGNKAFYGCVSLENLDFEYRIVDGDIQGVEHIGEAAFAKNSSIDAIILPSSVKRIEKNAFYRCYEAETLELGSGVEYIGDYAFEGVSASTLILPASLVEIGKYSFRRMTNLESVSVPDTVEIMNTGVFYECNNATLYVEYEEIPLGWNVRFNPSFRPVVYGVTLSEDKSYVSSVVVVKENFSYGDEDKVGYMAPQRRGYEFVGWASQDGGETAYDYAHIGDAPSGTELFSQWSIINYTITYEMDSGVNASSNPASYTVESDLITLSAPTREGYSFKGWYSDASFGKQVTAVAGGEIGDITLYAKWQSITLTVDLSAIENFAADGATAYIYVIYRDGTDNAWPGKQMTYIGDGKYTYIIDENKEIASIRVIKVSAEGSMLDSTDVITNIPADNYFVIRLVNGKMTA